MQFGQLLPTFFGAAYLQDNLCPTDHLSLTVLSREFWMAMKGLWKKKGEHANLGKGQVECRFFGRFFLFFPKGEIILGILEMPGTHEKPKLP